MDTPERNDQEWLKTTKATWTEKGPEFSFEPIDVRHLAPRARKYAVNQISIVKKLMGENFLSGFDSAAGNN